MRLCAFALKRNWLRFRRAVPLWLFFLLAEDGAGPCRTAIYLDDAHVDVLAAREGRERQRLGPLVSAFGREAFDHASAADDVDTLDGCRARHREAKLVFDGVQVGRGALLGEVGDGASITGWMEQRATSAICMVALGACEASLELTSEYVKTRKQFGVPIGSFQALKHRAANEYVQTELSRSAVYYAAMTLDENMPDAARAVSTAKARCNDAFHLVANESIQMHGGIGMTDEHDIGFFFKRARVSKVTLGDSEYHRDRYARLKEY